MDEQGGTLVELLSRKVVGQPAAMQYIVPYLQMYQSGLAPADRPAGIFLLLGPTGHGKDTHGRGARGGAARLGEVRPQG